MSLTFGSLFAGIGGFDLGFERAGMVCKWQVEIDDYCQKVLAKHWPHVHRERDIRECGSHNLAPVDVICGGFPCQDISYAGLGAGLDGERSGLFFEAIRLVCELRPQIVVLENVAALLTRGLDRVLGTLAEIGYDGEWHCIPAAAVGAPHQRERIFVMAYSKHGWLARRRGADRPEKAVLFDTRVCQFKPSGGTFKTDSALASVARANSGWKREPGVCRVANGVSNRSHRMRGLGNAVVPQVAELIGRRIVDATTAQQIAMGIGGGK